ncbi:MAG: hypothetical protein IPI91_07185 [Flavobacteriales bacterium]|nr:hypothetical protein [Flavobacteriales bacterium]
MPLAKPCYQWLFHLHWKRTPFIWMWANININSYAGVTTTTFGVNGPYLGPTLIMHPR